MALFVDARIPVTFGALNGEGDASFTPSGVAAHAIGCACCTSRSEDALALDRLFLARVRGEVPWFRRIVVPTDNAALRASIVADPVLAARFRIEG